jgi:hypothetical protein
LQKILASLASLAENKFKLPDHSNRDGKVVSTNEINNPKNIHHLLRSLRKNSQHQSEKTS